MLKKRMLEKENCKRGEIHQEMVFSILFFHVTFSPWGKYFKAMNDLLQ